MILYVITILMNNMLHLLLFILICSIKTEEKYYDAYVCSNGNTLYYARWFYD